MIDLFTGSKIGVESTDTDGSYVIVPAHQMDALCRLLTEHCIPHSVEGEVPSRHHAEAPAELVVRVSPAIIAVASGLLVEVKLAQDVLDLAP